jgi:hypothetical protein
MAGRKANNRARRKPNSTVRRKPAGEVLDARDKGRVEQQSQSVHRADLGLMFVHGIGNQKAGRVMHGMARPCIDAMAVLCQPSGYEVHESRQLIPFGVAATEPRVVELQLRGADTTRTVLVAEAIWSDAFPRPNLWSNVVWLLRSLPAVVLLLAPDHRDAAVLDDDSAPNRSLLRLGVMVRQALRLDRWLVAPETQFLLRLAYRLAIGLLLVSLPALLFRAYPVLGALALAAVAVYLGHRANVVGHVVVAASRPAALQKMTDAVRDQLTWLEARCHEVVVVAHSQGGFVCHHVLVERESAPHKVSQFIGVGSGLRPIWLLQQMQDRTIATAAWLMFLASIVGTVIATPIVMAGMAEDTLAFLSVVLATLGR